MSLEEIMYVEEEVAAVSFFSLLYLSWQRCFNYSLLYVWARENWQDVYAAENLLFVIPFQFRLYWFSFFCNH